MRWKIILGVILIILIAGLLLRTNVGDTYLGFVNNAVGKVTSFFAGILKFPKSSPGNLFSAEISLNREVLNGFKFQLTNTTFLASGNCVNFLINDVQLTAQATCGVTIPTSNGKLEVSEIGSLIVDVQTDSLVVSGSQYAGNLHVNFEILPTSFIISPVEQEKMSIAQATGYVQKLKDDGSIDIVKYLNGEPVEIDNFIGGIRMENSAINMDGFASLIKGKDFTIPV